MPHGALRHRMDCRSAQLDASAGTPSHETERLGRLQRALRGRAIRGNARVVILDDNPGPFEPLVSSGSRFDGLVANANPDRVGRWPAFAQLSW